MRIKVLCVFLSLNLSKKVYGTILPYDFGNTANS